MGNYQIFSGEAACKWKYAQALCVSAGSISGRADRKVVFSLRLISVSHLHTVLLMAVVLGLKINRDVVMFFRYFNNLEPWKRAVLILMILLIGLFCIGCQSA